MAISSFARRSHRMSRPGRCGARILVACLTVCGGLFAAMPASHAATAYDPATDPYSMANLTATIGAQAWWNAGYTGQGVDVALIDTGVSPVEGLATPGKVINGPDLSLESQAPNLTNLDTNGHGTFMAGIIAGHDTALTTPYSSAPASSYRGVAPDARIVSLKVATADGGVDVTQVIAAIDWVVQHKNDNGLNIRVLNLSYGTNSTQPAATDPLSYAVEQAWKAGIAVVVAAGNTGYQRGNNAPGLADPAYNPAVIAAGGYDPMGTATFHDDIVGDYSASSAGCGSCKNPDFVAVGSHVQGLRVPNSYVDVNHPEGMLSDRYFRGSGSSEAAAVTSGTIALILQKYPNLTPDQVKRYIANNGQKVPGSDSQAQGGGEINLPVLLTKTPQNYTQKYASSNGTGSIEAARGTDHVTADGVTLTGEQDIFGTPIDTTNLAQTEATQTSWASDGTWDGHRWSGNTWAGNSWSSSAWDGHRWSGSRWSTGTWSGATWDGHRWSGSTWAGNSWSGSRWSGHTWSDASWT
jgi:serine protease AprX